MALFTRDSIDRLRDAIDMVQLVSAKTDLRRVGSRWTGLCPFHDERTPSFSVDADKKVFYCFGCQEKGDAFHFVEKSEGLEFRDAVERLAERFGVELELENEDPRAEELRRRRQRLHALLERTAKFYATYLWESQEALRARGYLEGRGLGEEVLREFSVGYAPSAWDRVLVGAQRDGFSTDELLATGLAQRGRERGGLYDRFRGRIMFPLRDRRGKVVGFGARAMRDEQGPKYLNTSENDIYKKGSQLFGIDLARSHAGKAGRIVVVEGYTDVLALHQAGVRESVAIMGTSLTTEQVRELTLAAPVIVLALDADRSGQEAMLRGMLSAAGVAEKAGVELRAVGMPAGNDPADILVAGGAGAFATLLEGALTMVQFQVRRVLADADLGTPTGRDRALKEAGDLIAATSEGTAMRDELVREAADRLDVPPEYVIQASKRTGPADGQSASRMSAGRATLGAESEFLTLCLASGELGQRFLSQASDDQFSSPVMQKARSHLLSHFDDPLVGLPEDDPDLGALVTDVAHAALARSEQSEPSLRMSILQLEKRRIEREIRRAPQQGEHARQSELAAQLQRVRGELDEVMGQTA